MAKIWISLFVLAFLAALLTAAYSWLVVASESDDASEAEFARLADTPKPKESWVKYPVPLDDDLQKYICKKCAEYQVSPALVMAVIGTESGYKADAIGDHGAAYGLMQIQRKWHEARMERLGVMNLLNPYENVTVGIDLLSELLDRGNGVEWALSYYSGNGGAECEYSEKVMRLAECIMEGVMVADG